MKTSLCGLHPQSEGKGLSSSMGGDPSYLLQEQIRISVELLGLSEGNFSSSALCFFIIFSRLPWWFRLVVKNLPARQETQVRFLCQEDPLEKGMVTHSSTLAWRIPWTEEPGRLKSIGLQGQTQLSN